MSSVAVHLGARCLSTLFADRESANVSDKRAKQVFHILRNEASCLAAQTMLLTALSVTNFYYKLASLAFALALPLVKITCETLIPSKKISILDQDYRLGKLANLVSIVTSVVAIILGATPLIGLGGVVISANLLLCYYDGSS